MKKIIGLAIIAFGVFVEITWLGICFGSVIIGILLLIFAPRILFFPFNFFLLLGFMIMNGKNYKYYRDYKKQSFNYNNHSNTHQSSLNEIEKYYKVLESSNGDTLSTVKQNYRRIIKEYHYDSIASKGLPDDILKFAEEKTKELNEAYAAVKKVKK